MFKNSDSFHKISYRPTTVLLPVSKDTERLLANQMLPFVNNFMSPKIRGYQRGFNTEYVLIKMVEACKKTLDNKGLFGAALMDLSKAFDCLNHELLLAKLNAYGFSASAMGPGVNGKTRAPDHVLAILQMSPEDRFTASGVPSNSGQGTICPTFPLFAGLHPSQLAPQHHWLRDYPKTEESHHDCKHRKKPKVIEVVSQKQGCFICVKMRVSTPSNIIQDSH